MYILWDGSYSEPEIEISDSWSEMRQLGQFLINLNKDSILYGVHKKSKFYPKNLKIIKIILERNETYNQEQLNLLKVFLDKDSLVFEGNKLAFRKLGQSLLNFFNEDSKNQEHFHLDYTEGDMLLAPTNCYLIFMCAKK